jgi:hypothetical protein
VIQGEWRLSSIGSGQDLTFLIGACKASGVTPYLGVKVTGSRADGCEMGLSGVVSELERS